MDFIKIKHLVTQISGTEPKTYDDSELSALAEFLANPDLAGYLRSCLPNNVVGVSGVRLLPLNAIQGEMSHGSAPGSFIRPYGYLIVATSIGGNAVCFHSHSGRVFWADHVSFQSGTISYENRSTGEWTYVYEYSPANVEKALVLLSEDIETFLCQMLAGHLKVQLDRLD